jgi:N-acetylglucosaminyldiphosphoundecaprenol N-acetyl-beta-D-mannosaminyltransferase
MVRQGPVAAANGTPCSGYDAAEAPLPAPERIDFLGVPIDNLSFEELCTLLDGHISAHKPCYLVTPNVDHICRFHRDAVFAAAYRNATYSLADGKPIMWAARWLGTPLQEKLSGSDMVVRLSEFAAQRSYRVFYLGAAEGVAAKAAEELSSRFPGLEVVGTYSPPMDFELDPEQVEQARRQVIEAGPDICFVGLGSPKQEVWVHTNYLKMGAPVTIGVGAGLDFVAGVVRRAPKPLQAVGLEWLWRLCLEPRRLWRRYLLHDLLFLRLLMRAWLKSARADDVGEGHV